MKLFRYKPGGAYQIRIQEETFCESRERMTGQTYHYSEEERAGILAARQKWRALAAERGLDRFDDTDLQPVPTFTILMDALMRQIEADGVPEVVIYRHRHDLPADCFQQVQEAYEAFQTRERRFLARKAGDETVVLSIFGSVSRAVQELYTGKNEEMRAFEKQVVTYVAGDSPSARKYLMKLLMKHGVHHDGLRITILAIRDEMLLAELAYKSLNQH